MSSFTKEKLTDIDKKLVDMVTFSVYLIAYLIFTEEVFLFSNITSFLCFIYFERAKKNHDTSLTNKLHLVTVDKIAELIRDHFYSEKK